jgi:predicted AAA+ superfamily ATPase
MYVKRDIIDLFNRSNQVYDMVAIIGPRQAGKTTFLQRQSEGTGASYVLFDDPDPRSIFDEDIKRFETQYIEGNDLTVLDEVQYCKDAGQKLKYLVDTGRRLWITSSSEVVLSEEVLSFLVGRVSILRLYPFNISEFLRARGYKVSTGSIIGRSIWEHMTYGGYPQVVLTEGVEMKTLVLKNLAETMMLKDVKRSFSIEKTTEMERCVKYLAINTGGLVNYENLGGTLGISYETLRKYLDALEKSYFVVSVPPFYSNRSRELVKRPKVYFLDTGLRNAVMDHFPNEPDGILFENYVLTELVKLGTRPRYWRTKAGAEVDFIVEVEGRVVPIEVKLGGGQGRVPRSLRSFIRTYGPDRAFVVSYRTEETRTSVEGCTVVHTDIVGLRRELLESEG